MNGSSASATNTTLRDGAGLRGRSCLPPASIRSMARSGRTLPRFMNNV